jgi:hypothetical protein
MDIKLLKKELSLSKISKNAYSVMENDKDESLCIHTSKNHWIVFYSERGLRTGEKIFTNENDACIYFLNYIKSWNL